MTKETYDTDKYRWIQTTTIADVTMTPNLREEKQNEDQCTQTYPNTVLTDKETAQRRRRKPANPSPLNLYIVLESD